jgi:hypothetical protein
VQYRSRPYEFSKFVRKTALFLLLTFRPFSGLNQQENPFRKSKSGNLKAFMFSEGRFFP